MSACSCGWRSGNLPHGGTIPEVDAAMSEHRADAVIAALGLMEGIVSFDGERQRCWATPWERIEDDT